MQGGDRFETQLTHVLDHLPAGTVEMMVHPGRVDAALESVDGYTWQRRLELTALLSPAVRAQLRERNVILCRFDEI